MQASATHLLLDEKRCHAPLLVRFERPTGGEPSLGLVDDVVRDEPLPPEMLSGRSFNGRCLQSCVHAPPHNQANKSECRPLRREENRVRHRERQMCM